jgi:signal transduction histidine kinase/CheY-like chemotaxis protein
MNRSRLGFPRPRSLAEKITLLLTGVGGLAVVLTSFSVALSDHEELRRVTLETLRSQAEIIALHSGAPLVFGDRQHGADTIGVLRVAPDAVSATLFDRPGRVFAQWRRGDGGAPEPGELPPGETEVGRWLVLSTPVHDRGERQGQLQVVFDLGPLRTRYATGLATAALVSLLAMTLVYFTARRLASGLTGPIDELVRTARAVSESGDQSLRARRLSDDELGDLTSVFNEMLARTEDQAAALRRADVEREGLLESERTARLDAERASRSKDEFVATLSHELRTPLTPILGWVQILRLGGRRDPELEQALEVIERNVRLQSQLIEDLLDMNRIVSGRLRLDVRRVDLAEVARAAIDTVRPAAEARGIRIVTELDPRATPVRGDPERLQQVLWNLLSNAIKFGRKDGLVRVALERVGSQVELSVADDGVGIAPDFLPHVFDRFRQADGSTTRRYAGLGLGLAIARQLAELHGGTLRARSEGEGLGATFVLALPVPALLLDEAESGAHPAATADAAPAPELPSLRGLDLLVVDDDADSRALVERVLRQSDASVRLAASAEEALDALAAEPADLLISDIGMPGVDGFELIRRVRALEQTTGRSIPAIALTAFARAEDRTRALLAGYQSHISKPVLPAELLAAVASLLHRTAPAPAPAPGGPEAV